MGDKNTLHNDVRGRELMGARMSSNDRSCVPDATVRIYDVRVSDNNCGDGRVSQDANSSALPPASVLRLRVSRNVHWNSRTVVTISENL